MADITCERCGREGQQLPKPPLKDDLGQRVYSGICRTCWDEWLQYQTALINHYGLDVRTPDAREFLKTNMKGFLFDAGDTEEIDTSKEGTIEW